MAKKRSKRPNLPQETLARARAELHGEAQEPVTVTESSGSNGAAAAAAARPKAAAKRPGTGLATRRIPSISELIEEYSYVLRDLRNLAILAVILFVIIIASALVLPRPLG
jgi:tripartite-type tricarboxylate transporter receptor subunit TctC